MLQDSTNPLLLNTAPGVADDDTPAVFHLSRDTTRQLFKTTKLVLPRRVLLQLRANAVLRPQRYSSTIVDVDPAVQGLGKPNGSTPCCSLIVSSPPSFDGLQIDSWMVTHFGNKDLVVLKMSTIADDSESDSDNGDPEPGPLPAAAPSKTAGSHIPTRTLVPSQQAAGAVQARPVAAVVIPRAPVPTPTPDAGGDQQAEGHRPTAVGPLSTPGPARPFNAEPTTHSKRKIQIIVSERLTMPVKTLSILFPYAHLPIAAYIRVVQDGIIGTTYLPVTISEMSNHTSTSRVLMVDGLSGGMLCGKALISWALDPTPVRERQVAPGPFSVDRVCLLLEVASPPPGVNIPGDAKLAIAKVGPSHMGEASRSHVDLFRNHVLASCSSSHVAAWHLVNGCADLYLLQGFNAAFQRSPKQLFPS